MVYILRHRMIWRGIEEDEDAKEDKLAKVRFALESVGLGSVEALIFAETW